MLHCIVYTFNCSLFSDLFASVGLAKRMLKGQQGVSGVAAARCPELCWEVDLRGSVFMSSTIMPHGPERVEPSEYHRSSTSDRESYLFMRLLGKHGKVLVMQDALFAPIY
jgi:hypothetical protein